MFFALFTAFTIAFLYPPIAIVTVVFKSVSVGFASSLTEIPATCSAVFPTQ